MGWSEILVSNGCFGSLFDHFTLGARDFSSAVSGFCQQGQVFIVTRSWLRPPGGGGYSHTLPIRVCAARRGRDFEAPDFERGIHFRGVF